MSNGIQTIGGYLAPAGYVQITSLGSAAGLTSIPADCKCCLIQAETQSVRWRDDGTNPTTSVGLVITAGTSLWYYGTMSAIKFIEVTGSAKLNISYYK